MSPLLPPSSPPPPPPPPPVSPPPSVPTVNASTLPRLLDPALSHLRDITLIPGKSPDRTIRAHRFILAAASPVLRASLTADPTATVLTLAHADADTLDAALQYVYGRPQPINNLPVHSLWTALSTCIAYAILHPLDAVQTRLVNSVHSANVFYHWAMAEKYSLDRVLLKCRNLVKHNFLAVSKHPQFLHISPHTLARVLRIHDLIVYTEDDVFQALERWLAYDVDNRAEHALHLLRLVRLPTLPDSILLRVCRSPYFGGHNEFYQLLLEALIRRTEVRIVHAPRIASVQTTCRANLHTNNPSTSSTNPQSPVSLHFKPLGVTDNDLLPASPSSLPTSDGKTHPPSPRDEPPDLTIDYNRREDRAVLFEGLFPLRWYKSVRFRPRSASSLLFTVVIPKWSSCRRRFISESRSFLNHKWSMWVDPFSADPARGPAVTREHSELSPVSKSLENKDANNLYVGDTIDRTTSTSSPTASSTPRPPSFSADDSDYISIYLCCESELGSSQKVDARVDFGLFVVSTSEEYGMERKVCVGRTFRSHGQAMGFRRHIRRNRMQSKSEGLYNAEKDELVVGAHLVAPDVMRPELVHSAFSQLSRASMTGDDFRSESPLSPSSGQLEASRLTTMDTEPSPILTATSRVTS